MLQTYLNPQKDYPQSPTIQTYLQQLSDLLNKNYKNHYIDLIKLMPIISGLDYHTFYKNNHNFIYQLPSKPINYQFSYWSKTHKKKLWSEISSQPYPQNLYCKFLKISHSQLNPQELESLLKNPFFSKFLQSLDLLSNSFTLKPDSLVIIDKYLKNLTHLSLKNNLQVINFPEFNKLTLDKLIDLNLENTNLQDNILEIIPEKFPLLITLNISKNHNLKTFTPLNQYTQKNLKKLVLSYTSIDLEQIKQLLETSEKLEYLDISYCKIPSLQQNLTTLTSSNIKTLCLQSLTITLEPLQLILEKFPQLQKLDLEKNTSLSSQKLENLTIPSHTQQNLQWISLKECSFDETDQHRKDEKDRKFDMEQKGEEYTPFEYGFIPFNNQIISHIVLKLPNLNFIDLSYNKLTNTNFSLLMEGLRENNNQIHHLELGSCELTQDIVKYFVNSPILSNLQSLGLRENSLTDEFLHTLKSDKQIQQLKYLNLSNCKLSEQGFYSLIDWAESALKNLVDFRFSENVSRQNQEQYLEILSQNLDLFPSLKKVTLGSGLQNPEEIPQNISKKSILIAPFYGDGLD